MRLNLLRARARLFAALFATEMRAYLRNRVSVFWVFGFPVLLFVILGFAVGADLGIVRVHVQANAPAAIQPLLRHVSEVLRHSRAYQTEFVADPAAAHLAIRVVGTSPARLDVEYEPSQSGSIYLALRTIEGAVLEHSLTATAAVPAQVHNRLRAGASEPLPFDRFLYSGIVVLMLLSGGILSLAYVLTSQREQNVLKAIAVQPLSPALYLLGVMSARLSVMLVAAATFLVIGAAVFGQRFHLDAERAAAILALALASGALFLSIGFVIAARTGSSGSAELVGSAVYYPLLLLGNLTIPLREMPLGIDTALRWLPTSQVAESLRSAMYAPAAFEWPSQTLLLLVTLTALFVLLGARSFRFVNEGH
jgi:ABC-type multidrug transport system permease subunit